jgi:hypothetical protein
VASLARVMGVVRWEIDLAWDNGVSEVPTFIFKSLPTCEDVLKEIKLLSALFAPTHIESGISTSLVLQKSDAKLFRIDAFFLYFC